LFIDLKLTGKTVIVVGGGSEAYRKVQSFLDTGATIWVISREFSNRFENLCKEKKVALVKTCVKDPKVFVNNLKPKPDLLLAATDDNELNLELVKAAIQLGSLVYAIDNPAVSDFILPAVAKVGDVKVAVSTGGKSPAMARVLRKRIEKIITSEDLLQIKLQDYVRTILKKKVKNQKVRREVLCEILESSDIKELLKQGKIDRAKEKANEIVQESILITKKIMKTKRQKQ